MNIFHIIYNKLFQIFQDGIGLSAVNDALLLQAAAENEMREAFREHPNEVRSRINDGMILWLTVESRTFRLSIDDKKNDCGTDVGYCYSWKYRRIQLGKVRQKDGEYNKSELQILWVGWTQDQLLYFRSSSYFRWVSSLLFKITRIYLRSIGRRNEISNRISDEDCTQNRISISSSGWLVRCIWYICSYGKGTISHIYLRTHEWFRL